MKGLIFDYGGTIDTAAVHWSHILWQGYLSAGVPVTEQEFRTSYVWAERELARKTYILPQHNFLDLLRIKCDLETSDLVMRGVWITDEDNRRQVSEQIALFCDRHVRAVLEDVRPVLATLAERFPMVIVSNFYGNLQTVLKEYNLPYFQRIIESQTVGIRKPDPEIFRLGIQALGLKPDECTVIGDSWSKDILPAASLGCNTVWFQGRGWDGDDTLRTLDGEDNVKHCSIKKFGDLLNL